MRICPRCKNELQADASLCDSCGLIFLEVVVQELERSIEAHGRLSIDRTGSQSTSQAPAVKRCRGCGQNVSPKDAKCWNCGVTFYAGSAIPPRRTRRKKKQKWAKIREAVLVCAIVLAIQNFSTLRSWFGVAEESPQYPQLLEESPTASARFDVSIDLLDRGSGLTWNDREFILGKQDQQGFLRLVQNGEKYAVRTEQIIDIRPLAWTGSHFIGFRQSVFLMDAFTRHYFTVHDAETLRVVDEYPAPEAIGGLAWDGLAYWAASRSENKQARGLIYRLDKNFVIKNKMAAPSSSCGGLAWDKTFLWFLDDRAHRLFVLNVKGVQAFIHASYDLPLKSVSGIAFDGKRIWISDDHRKRLVRMRPGFGNSRAMKW